MYGKEFCNRLSGYDFFFFFLSVIHGPWIRYLCYNYFSLKPSLRSDRLSQGAMLPIWKQWHSIIIGFGAIEIKTVFKLGKVIWPLSLWRPDQSERVYSSMYRHQPPDWLAMEAPSFALEHATKRFSNEEPGSKVLMPISPTTRHSGYPRGRWQRRLGSRCLLYPKIFSTIHCSVNKMSVSGILGHL